MKERQGWEMKRGGGGATNITVLFTSAQTTCTHPHAHGRAAWEMRPGTAGTGCVMRFVRRGGGVATTLPRSQQYALDGFV